MSLPPADPPEAPVPEPKPPLTGGAVGLGLVVIAAVLVVALLVTTGLGRYLRSPPVALTAMITVLPYLYGVVLAAIFGLWALVPDRRAMPALLGAVLLVGAILWGPALASWGDGAAGLPVRVASWNVRRLWGGPDDSQPAGQCVIETLREVNADVLALQEVSRDELVELRRALDLHCVQTDYLRRGDANDGGLAVCVREESWALHSGTPARFDDQHNWHYVFAEIERQGQVFNILSVHLQPYRLKTRGINAASGVAERQGNQSAELLRRVQRFRDPTVLAGDFNSTRDAAIHVAIRDTMTDAFEAGGTGFGSTFQLMGWLPIRIDHVYVSDAFAVREAQILNKGCSDHKPVVTDLVLKE